MPIGTELSSFWGPKKATLGVGPGGGCHRDRLPKKGMTNHDRVCGGFGGMNGRGGGTKGFMNGNGK